VNRNFAKIQFPIDGLAVQFLHVPEMGLDFYGKWYQIV
jgi:hypothetical protein